MSEDAVRRSINGVWRIESARLIAGLVRMVKDVGLAEDLAQDALLAALTTWPASGIPDNPGAWLMQAARRRAIDKIRRGKTAERKYGMLGYELEQAQASGPDLDEALDDPIGDDLLRLMFIACHPVLATDARIALTLRLVAGLTSEEIARAFLSPLATIQQRIVRAKRTLAAARVPFETLRPAELAQRLGSVLEVIYLVFNEGYAATAGDNWVRPALCDDALRLGRILAGLMPGEAEVHGLVALMEFQASRLRARTAKDGTPILLNDQDRSRWDRVLIRRGLAALERAERLGASLGPYALQATIAACHARAPTPEYTDWTRIAALYDALGQLTPSPVIEVNRAVAHAQAFGPAAGLEILEPIRRHPALAAYHLLHAVPRRAAGAVGKDGRGAQGIRAGGEAHPQRAGAGAAADARGGVNARVMRYGGLAVALERVLKSPSCHSARSQLPCKPRWLGSVVGAQRKLLKGREFRTGHGC